MLVNNVIKPKHNFASHTSYLCTALDTLSQAKAVLLDWDGCIAIGDIPTPQAISFIKQWEGRCAIVSNNTSHLPEEFTQILAKYNIEMPVENIILAGIEAIKHATKYKAKRIMIIGNTHMKAFGHRLGLNLVNDNAELIVLLRDARFSYAKLERAANSLKDGAKLIVGNPDLTHPGVKGRIVPETGALLAALLACTNDDIKDIEIIGKPSSWLFERALNLLKVSAIDSVMIGDNPRTDILGAQGVGLNQIQIGLRPHIGFSDLLNFKK